MGKYIKLIMDDAIIDYKKDNPDENPIIKRSGNIIAGMLRQFIAKNGAQNA
jgi:hypothetical protein